MTNPFLRLMTQTVSWEQKTGLDIYGAPVFASPQPVICRWVQRPARLSTQTGVMVLAQDVLWMAPDVAVTAEDRFTLPDGRVTLVRVVERAPGPDGELYATRVACW